MNKTRLETFSDAVLAIIITIMVLDLKRPAGHSLQALVPLVPIFVSYTLSYVTLGTAWNSHHQLFQTVRKVDAKVLWANLHILFWLSLLPFATGWMGESQFATWPTAVYGFVSFMATLSFTLLSNLLIRLHGNDSDVARLIVGRATKERPSLLMYAVSIGLCFINVWLGFIGYVVVVTIWCIPELRTKKKQMH